MDTQDPRDQMVAMQMTRQPTLGRREVVPGPRLAQPTREQGREARNAALALHNGRSYAVQTYQ
jgi:hypothetical protein